MRGIIRNKKSFTLIEVIMVIVLMGIFSYGVSLYVLRVVDSWKFLTQRYALEQDSKLALDFMSRDLKEIGVDSSSDPTISFASDDAVTFTNIDSESIAYVYNSNIIYKNSQPLIKNVSSFQVKYYNQSNAEIIPVAGILSAAQIEDIWYLYLRFNAYKGDQSSAFNSYVFPRNFLSR
ncbi:MAG: prepilin-type N-terminal cleavage/methylation domain-containing protein [Candidatus Kaelpia aquatica]|nr:prepilin-type N-terminal cleavage/methylation domain-containing protein [Candidatus Kaelpia aquatica]